MYYYNSAVRKKKAMVWMICSQRHFTFALYLLALQHIRISLSDPEDEIWSIDFLDGRAQLMELW